jgi:NADH dehydrogenase
MAYAEAEAPVYGRRGTAWNSPMRYSNVLVIGGSGFVGRHLVGALTARGARATVPTRRRERAKVLLPLPTVDLVEADVHDRPTLERLARGCDLVINLVGVLHSRRGRRDERGPNDYGPDFARAHVELPQAIVAACRAAGVRRLLHMSALGADPAAPSEYLRSKGIGERVVLAADDLDVTVFRPSAIFGPDDRFLNLFVRLARDVPVIPLACPNATFQPVYVGDVAQALLAACDQRVAIGARYDLCGPTVYTLLGLGDTLSMAQARLLERLPGTLLTRDNLRSMRVPSVCHCAFPFGLAPQALAALAPQWLMRTAPRGAALRARAGR